MRLLRGTWYMEKNTSTHDQAIEATDAKSIINPNLSVIIFVLFVISGFCGLLYQIIWLRIALASFGVITPVLSVVVSVFMFGLAIGSWLGGRWSERWRMQTKSTPIYLYSICEFIICIGAFLTPLLFKLGENYLLSIGGTDSAKYLLLSSLIIAGSLIPWCTCMGMTYPSMMAFLGEVDRKNKISFSFLYLANVIGAMIGAILTAMVFIESVGIHNSLKIAAAGNLLIAAVSFYLGYRYDENSMTDKVYPMSDVSDTVTYIPIRKIFFYAILFLTGFCSMAMEIVWVRAFTPTLSTTIYAFAFILSLYLLATWIGSYRYRKHIDQKKVRPLESLISISILVSILPLVITDPRLSMIWTKKESLISFIGLVIGIYCFCELLGYMTPFLIDQYSTGSPSKAGTGYAVNITGCILGPLFAGYMLLPITGVKWAFVALSIPFVILFLLSLKVLSSFKNKDILFAVSGIIVLAAASLYSYSFEEVAMSTNSQVRRDYVATVVSSGEGMKKKLFVNGIGMTSLTPITKIMAHMPLAFRENPAQNALVICLGMGTTYRSLMSWDIQVKGIELIPSVKEAFTYYFDDASEIINNPRGEIIIDDGRRYLKRTTEKYDIITIDPPPPIESSGSSLLYSNEFYSVVKSRLKENGIVQQWHPGGEDKIVEAVTRSLVMSFPYVKIFKSVEGWGYHFIASIKPLETPTADIFIKRIPERAKKDLMEWYPDQDIRKIVGIILSKELQVYDILKRDEDVYISDDRPYNEYYLLRRCWNRLSNRFAEIY
ncbi:MAG: fused MFS/spermidine synthase [Bacillota bacterium]|nr:fused MFS/spermidine synthase [Bacillota bacterium]